MTAEREPITDAGRALSRDERGAIHREMVFWIGHQWHNEGGIASEYVRDNLVAYSDAVAIEARALGAREERERLREADAYRVAAMFHEAYERLAPDFGYETRAESSVPWDKVPAANRDLMAATVTVVLYALLADPTDAPDAALEARP